MYRSASGRSSSARDRNHDVLHWTCVNTILRKLILLFFFKFLSDNTFVGYVREDGAPAAYRDKTPLLDGRRRLLRSARKSKYLPSVIGSNCQLFLLQSCRTMAEDESANFHWADHRWLRLFSSIRVRTLAVPQWDYAYLPRKPHKPVPSNSARKLVICNMTEQKGWHPGTSKYVDCHLLHFP